MATNEEEMSEGAAGDATVGDQTAEEEALEKKTCRTEKETQTGLSSDISVLCGNLSVWSFFRGGAFRPVPFITRLAVVP